LAECSRVSRPRHTYKNQIGSSAATDARALQTRKCHWCILGSQLSPHRPAHTAPRRRRWPWQRPSRLARRRRWRRGRRRRGRGLRWPAPGRGLPTTGRACRPTRPPA
jgi:hypothetical protein